MGVELGVVLEKCQKNDLHPSGNRSVVNNFLKMSFMYDKSQDRSRKCVIFDNRQLKTKDLINYHGTI